jgi:hypothetical protein
MKRDLKSAVARLRASTTVDDEDKPEVNQYDVGFAKGQLWAKKTASVDELQRVEVLLDEYPRGLDSLAGHAAKLFAALILGHENEDRIAALVFWAKAFGPGATKLVFVDDEVDVVEGFADGAYDVWHDIKDEL